jgi:hypothetical protein
MSRSYGIGGMYLSDEIVDWHRLTKTTHLRIDGEIVRMPRFYKDKLWWKQDEKRQISESNKLKADFQRQKELDKAQELGYTQAQMEEFRRAYYSRLKQKVAYTEKI